MWSRQARISVRNRRISQFYLQHCIVQFAIDDMNTILLILLVFLNFGVSTPADTCQYRGTKYENKCEFCDENAWMICLKGKVDVVLKCDHGCYEPSKCKAQCKG